MKTVDQNDLLRYVHMLIQMRDAVVRAPNKNKRAHAAAEMRGAMKAADRLHLLPAATTPFALEMALTDEAHMVEDEHGPRPERDATSPSRTLARVAWDNAWAEKVVAWINR